MNDFENIDFWAENTDDKVKRLQSESQKLVKDKIIFRKFLEKQHNKVKDIGDLLGVYPTENEQIRIITQKSFNAYALLLYIVEKYNITECYLTTYNIDKNSIQGIKDLIESNNINNIIIVVSDSINFRMPKRAEELKKIAGKNIKIIFTWNHTKIILAKTDENYFVIEGSGNISDNARIEQYLFENCKETYLFHRDWINEIKEQDYKRIEVYE